MILHRKNAYFFRTERGAQVGDILMSLIETCHLNKVKPFETLVELQKPIRAVKNNPADWLPRNYKNTLS